MRILITTDAVGGVWHYSTTLAQALADGFAIQVLLVVCGPRPTEEQITALSCGPRTNGGSNDLDYIDMPLEWEGAEEKAYVAGRQALLQLALNWRAHILHANEHHLGQIGASGLPVLVVSHSDVCSWNAAMERDAIAAVDAAYMLRVITGLSSASLVVAPSTSVVESLSTWFGYRDVVRVIPNGVRPTAAGLAPARTIDAIMVGRLWDPAKNLACFQEAVAGWTPGAFVAVGPLAPPGQRAAVTKDGTIHYPGQLPNGEVRALFARAHILVAPARYEPFGLAAVEAALAGCCLVLNDIPSYRAIWENTAVYFHADEPRTLRTTLRALLDDPDRRHALATRARRRAESRYTADRMARAYLATYQRLAL
ncbi:MAG TPA: glycosyltransferase family 4 protein, partial [Chloroflexota bacterium]|nr:glycosyltransferase family 4 protein [Chloroflexota bacterium]